MLPPTPETLKTCARLLLNGGVAVIPTDTVYGIAAHPAHPKALQRICTIKGRLSTKPVALLAADTSAIIRFGASLPPAATTLAHAFWPGALTMVLPCHDIYEGFRIPALLFTRQLLHACGGLLRVTSANLSGSMPAATAAAAFAALGISPDQIIDNGPSPDNTPSTVIRITPTNQIDLIRQGAITQSQINQHLAPHYQASVNHPTDNTG